jgi:hypothetical protein
MPRCSAAGFNAPLEFLTGFTPLFKEKKSSEMLTQFIIGRNVSPAINSISYSVTLQTLRSDWMR